MKYTKILSTTLLLLSASAIAFAGGKNKPRKPKDAELATVPYVDINQYAGKWYEIASFPQRFQNGCNCTTAEYALNSDGTVSVKNTCLKDNKIKTATAKATIVDKCSNAKLDVQFFWPFKGQYWIIELASDYSYAVVGHPSREYLWILSRTPQMEKATYDAIVENTWQKGFDVTKLRKTVQCEADATAMK